MKRLSAFARDRMGQRRGIIGLPGFLLLLAVTVPEPAAAQMYGPRMASREELTASLDSLQEVLAVTKNRERVAAIQRENLGIRYRLQHGDIRAGDVISLSVAGESKWTSQFTVSRNRRLELPDIESIPLEGVLYAEVEATIASALSRYLREPRIRMDVLKRIAILGAVGTPGFYNVSGSALVSDALMLAGGPTTNAKVRRAKIRRGEERVASGRPRVAFESLSLDQLGVVSGDELFVPAKGAPPATLILGLLGAATSIVFIITQVNN